MNSPRSSQPELAAKVLKKLIASDSKVLGFGLVDDDAWARVG